MKHLFTWNGFKESLSAQIFLAMILGLGLGVINPDFGIAVAPIGDLFIKLIKMLVIPLIIFAIVGGAIKIAESKEVGFVGTFTLSFFFITSLIGSGFGLAMGLLFKPGEGVSLPATTEVITASEGEIEGVWATILGMIPSNIFEGLMLGNLMQVIVFSVFFGLALSTLTPERKAKITFMLDAANDAMIWMIMKVLAIAPYGVFAIMASSVGTFGLDILSSVFKMFLVFCVVQFVIQFVFLPGLVYSFSGISPKKFLTGIKDMMAFSFTSASSFATVPISKRNAEELGVRPSISGFVIPLGSLMNMIGNASMFSLIAVFFAQMYNVDITLAGYVNILLISVLGAVAQAGVPGPSLLSVTVLVAAGIPLTGLPIIFAVDRILDMMRTTTNVTGDVTTAICLEWRLRALEKSRAEKGLEPQEIGV
jgi:proton glutamate symport protein